MHERKEINDYAVIGDCRSAALVSRTGAIEWLCWPRFESSSLFGALLDAEQGGCFVIQPATPFTVERRYLDDTNVLETTFRTSTGVARLLDLMPVAPEAEKCRMLRPAHQVLRRLECIEGEVSIALCCNPRPDYGRVVPTLRDRGSLGFYYEYGKQLLILRGDVPLIAADRAMVQSHFTLCGGERRYVALGFSDGEPAIIPMLGEIAEAQVRESIGWWRQWAARCKYEGPYRAAVVRSALVLKLLTFAPSGAVIAAPSTSLPEELGGASNWDYRYCWLRDASLTLQALCDLGYDTEAQAYLSWLLHTTRITWPKLRILYDVFGRPDLPEQELDHLAGFSSSRPVRIGNAAVGQLQLDVYGEVLDAVYQFTLRGGQLDRETARMAIGLGETVCCCWREADEGIWEPRQAREHHTLSKAMCWVALDRLAKLHEAGYVHAPLERFARVQQEIRSEIERRGFNKSLGSYVSVFDGNDVDASLLLLVRYGYVDPDSPRARGTLALILKRLGRDGLVYRYRNEHDGPWPSEGAFGICGFWAVVARARAGDLAGATRVFEHLLGYANDLGLYAEEIDPSTGAALGNFPQAFTHVGLIDAALTLEEFVEPVRSPTQRAANSRLRVVAGQPG